MEKENTYDERKGKRSKEENRRITIREKMWRRNLTTSEMSVQRKWGKNYKWKGAKVKEIRHRVK